MDYSWHLKCYPNNQICKHQGKRSLSIDRNFLIDAPSSLVSNMIIDAEIPSNTNDTKTMLNISPNIINEHMAPKGKYDPRMKVMK